MPHCGNGISKVTGSDSPALDYTNNLRRNNGNKENTSRGATDQNSPASIGSAAAHATFPSWINIILMVSLIFGGCCANVGKTFKHTRPHVADNLPQVFALEAIIKDQPSSGPLITFVQFILTALFTFPSFFSRSAGPRSLFLSPRAIPLSSWLVYTAFFVTINLLNNWAFAYKISVPLHIIVRSGGPVASMVIGYLFNAKRYSQGQIMAVILLTLGVVGAALADAEASGHSISLEAGGNGSATATAIIGFSILVLAMILSAFQGIFADRLYEKHGRSHWKEALFYSHTLSLPLFLATYPQLLSQWRNLLSSPSLLSKISTVSPGNGFTATTTTFDVLSMPASIPGVISSITMAVKDYEPAQVLLAKVPIRMAYLLINALTQFLCIRGVHLLSAKTSSLTVTIVLNIRKLVSLLLSIYLFGNELAPGVLVGAAFVFAGGGLYGFEGARLREKSLLKKD